MPYKTIDDLTEDQQLAIACMVEDGNPISAGALLHEYLGYTLPAPMRMRGVLRIYRDLGGEKTFEFQKYL